MTLPQIKVKIQRRPVIKLKVLPRFPADVTVSAPLELDRTGGGYSISLDISELALSLDSYFAPIEIVNGPIVVTTSSYTVEAGVRAIAIQRTSPTATAITLPAVTGQSGIPLSVIDWSTSVTEHAITLTPDGSETIMQAASYEILSTPSSQGIGLTLYPSTTLGGWYIAP